jgi:DNA polymerase-3 subunit epsilon
MTRQSQLVVPAGGVHAGRRPGDPGAVRRLQRLIEEQHVSIVIAAALAGDATFGDLGAIALSIESDLVTAATATLDAATTERTMLLAEIYRRDGNWRLRAIGQGYDNGLAELATRYRVDVDAA